MKQGSTLFLKAVIIMFGLLVLFLCVYALPQGIIWERTGYYRPILFGLYLPAIPFFIALYQGLKLLQLIDKNRAFSEHSAKALGYIKYCAFTTGALFAAGMPYIYYAADRDDAPGVVLLGLILVGASFVIATSAAVFQKLLQSAIDIKSENDLTV